ncbi:hypothetical protein IEQ34_018265 [Dendrobium chrysotoxum]|uniref:Uncharacterized protein n=1 Tax=Dendrobium chrysotoxum TaxID=161865 RepID=A0AAV7GBW1_DENCH|nr:hypothetical protein IEQ34_018265 [Dendrobium chrysotoxum]
MERMTGAANFNNLEKNPLLPPKTSFPNNVTPTYEDCDPSGSKDEPWLRKELIHDQPSSPESISIEEHFSWLIDLLDEPDTPIKICAHRPSSNFVLEECRQRAIMPLPLWGSLEFDPFNDVRHYFPDPNWSENKVVSPEELKSESENKDVSQTKHTDLQTDSKQDKQQFPQSSRVRKLQYITELENCAEGMEILAQLQYVEEQNFILSFENEVLKQRLNSMLQEQLIKCIFGSIWFHEYVDKEKKAKASSPQALLLADPSALLSFLY